MIAPYKKPWLFPHALRIAEQVVRPAGVGGKIDYAVGVDPREICNLRYLTVIRERLSAALRPGEGPERFLPALDEYQPIGSTDGLNFNSPKDKCVPAAKGCVFLKSVELRLSPGESPSCWSVRVFVGVPGVTWGDRCWSAGMSAGRRAGSGAVVAVPGPPVSGPVPGSWGGKNPSCPRQQ